MLLFASALAGVPLGDVHDLRHPIAIGVRTGAWAGPYQAPLLGGQIKVRAAPWIGFNGFNDNTLMVRGNIAQHDHIIGFNGYFPSLFGGRRAYLSPTLGSCVDFRISSPLDQRLPSSNVVLFGVHGGLSGEVSLFHRMTLEGAVEAFAYLGNGAKHDAWTASTTNTYQTAITGQFVATVNYAL